MPPPCDKTDSRMQRYRRLLVGEIRELDEELAANYNMRDAGATWLRRMNNRQSTLHTKIPHFPILVEHIHYYTSRPDYELKFIKTIQTVGEITWDSERSGKITTLTNERDDCFPVNFDTMKLNELYTKDPKGLHLPVWDKYHALKIFGVLERQEGKVVLNVTHFKPIQNMNLTIELMTFFSRIGQCTYKQFGKELQNNKLFRDYWNASKLSGMRVVQKKQK